MIYVYLNAVYEDGWYPPLIQRTLLIAGDLPYRIAYSTHKVPPSPPMKSQKPWIVPGTIQFKKMEFLIKTPGTVSSAKR